MANEEHVAILKQGVEAWNQWRVKNVHLSSFPNNEGSFDLPEINVAVLITHYGKVTPNITINIPRIVANCMVIDPHNDEIYNIDRIMTIVSLADLSHIDLSHADLNLTNLSFANLSHADLSGAKLHYADLSHADLSGANLSKANLNDANLSKANLHGTDWTGARCSSTIFGDVDLSQVEGLETVEHDGPSTIGIDTIYRSGGNIPEVFLRGAGVPDTFITFMRSLTQSAFDFYSCFICHSSKDRPFVERLYADLQSNGVRCWYAPEDLKIGEPFVLGIERGIRLHEKLLIVLSENSVGSNWVQHEVLSAMAKEGGKEPWVLFPIRLDNAVMETDVLWASMIRDSRHIADFSQWKDHDSYRKAFDKLLRDLKAGK